MSGPKELTVKVDFRRMAIRSFKYDPQQHVVSMTGDNGAVTYRRDGGAFQSGNYVDFLSLHPQYPDIFQDFITNICPGTNRRF